MTGSIRLARPDDCADILRLLRLLAAFEGESAPIPATVDSLQRDGFGETRRFEALLYAPQGTVRGLAVLFPGYSSWQAKPTLVLHDLFVEVSERGQGAGLALLKAAARRAIDLGACRLDVMVLASNESGRHFYESLRFQQLEAWQPYRLGQEGIARLAR